ncbi:Glycerol-3-phosphate dehydrogenase, NAD-dependent [Mycobacteroides abscessus subsp. abscessus]|nr:Glycerol-3-phosphate dehydrogenase, NAD-dependent [Mycobacteroides abscessus subsp. abscessus]
MTVNVPGSAGACTGHIAVLGAGSWGTVFSHMLAKGGNDVRLWARREELATEITKARENASYVPGLHLPARIEASSDIAHVLEEARGIVLAVPAQSLRACLEAWPRLPRVPVVSLIKGIERGSDERMSQVIAQSGAVSEDLIAVLSGPNLAREIAREQPCASVIASTSEITAREVASWCSAPYFRAYVSRDVTGIEVAGAMKNVIAIAVGAAAGLGYGDNTRASLITRGLAEITRLGVSLGAEPSTFAGLAGMGDLVATCASPLSRNFRLGKALGEGQSLEEAKASVGQTAEGVPTARAVADLADRSHLDLPITRALVDVVDCGRNIAEVTSALLSRSVRFE